MNEAGEPVQVEEGNIDSFDAAMKNLRTHVHRRDIIRKNLAYQLLWLIGVLTLALVVATISGKLPLASAKDMAGIILAPLIGIFATVIGFYFGAETK